MQYNVLAEVNAFALSMVLTISLIISKCYHTKRSRAFTICVASISANTFINLCSVYCIYNYTTVPVVISTIITSTYFLSLCFVPILFCNYIISSSIRTKFHSRLFLGLMLIPYIIFAIIVISSPYTHYIFYYANDGYHRGTLSFLTYVVMLAYIVVDVTITILSKDYLSMHNFKLLLIFPVFAVAIVSIQFFNPELLLTGTACFAPLLYIYFFVQNDLNNTDTITGCQLLPELRHSLNDRFANDKPFSVVIISLDNLDAELNYRRSLRNIALIKISKFFNELVSVKNVFLYSDDEFVLIFDGYTCGDDIKSDITKIHDFLAGDIIIEENAYDLSFNVGAIFCPSQANNNEDVRELLMYTLNQARKSGQDEVFYCDDATLLSLKHNKEILEVLQKELYCDDSGLDIHLQPIYSITHERFTHFEALARLENTSIGRIRPDEFIAVAEEYGLINRLGYMIIDMVCKFISENREAFETYEGISINLSVKQMLRDDIKDQIKEIIAKHNIPPEKLIIEITESVIIETFEEIKDKMLSLKELGIKFYLDDFGTGFSNFASVIELPFDVIKFDKTITQSLEISPKSNTLLNSLTTAFLTHGIDVLVEGVETSEQDALVKAANVTFIQGYYYSKPLPKDIVLNSIK
ncbi:MAG: EAL domain-containing protein [Lachnospira sp.]|nr:EAL domain-containing protein [Lachnospira sp.]